jgi:hypothetical protein
VRSNRRIHNLLSMVESLTFEPRSTIIDGIFVMKSVLRPQGAEYTVMKSIHFQS